MLRPGVLHQASSVCYSLCWRFLLLLALWILSGTELVSTTNSQSIRDNCQELIFSLPGFTGYGWYLTLIQFGYYSIFGKVRRTILLCQSVILILPDRNVAEAGGEESSSEDLHTSGHHYRRHNGLLQRQSGISQLPNTGEES